MIRTSFSRKLNIRDAIVGIIVWCICATIWIYLAYQRIGLTDFYGLMPLNPESISFQAAAGIILFILSFPLSAVLWYLFSWIPGDVLTGSFIIICLCIVGLIQAAFVFVSAGYIIRLSIKNDKALWKRLAYNITVSIVLSLLMVSILHSLNGYSMAVLTVNAVVFVCLSICHTFASSFVLIKKPLYLQRAAYSIVAIGLLSVVLTDLSYVTFLMIATALIIYFSVARYRSTW